MRSLILAILLFVLCIVFGAQRVPLVFLRLAQVQESSVPACVAVVPPVEPERVGERIVYDVIMGAVRLGTATYEHLPPQQLEGRTLSHIVFKTRVIKFTDTENIYGDPQTFLPVLIRRNIVSWPRQETITEEYDQTQYHLLITKQESGKSRQVSFQKNGVIHNAILLPFYVRKKAQFETGWKFKANLPTQAFDITLTGIEEVVVPYGKARAYRFESEPPRFTIWVSADERKVPLKIRGSAGIGYTMVMRDYAFDPPAVREAPEKPVNPE